MNPGLHRRPKAMCNWRNTTTITTIIITISGAGIGGIITITTIIITTTATSAANLKFLSGLLQARHWNFKFKAALESTSCWSSFDSEVRIRDRCGRLRTSESELQGDRQHAGREQAPRWGSCSLRKIMLTGGQVTKSYCWRAFSFAAR